MDGLLPFLKTCKLFAGLTDFEIGELAPFFEEKTIPKGEWIVQEGEAGDSLFILFKGSAEILKKEYTSNYVQNLGQIHAGDWFGEMAFLEEETRSASIRAVEDVKVYVLSLNALKKLNNEKAFFQIYSSLAKGISRRLRTTDASLVESLRENLRAVRLQEEIGRLIIQILIFFSIYINFVKLSAGFSPNSMVLQILTPLIIAIIFASGVYFLSQTNYPPAFYGITEKNWKKFALEGILWSVPMAVLMFLMKWFSIRYIPAFKTLPLIDLFPNIGNVQELIVFSTLYLLLIPAQEFIARGVLQGCFEEFFQGPNKALKAIIVSNLLFSVAHIAKTFSLSLVAFFMGLVWGVLYARQHSLVGVVVSHLLLGIWGFFILGYDKIFIY